MRYKTVLILMLMCSQSFASCICEDGSQGQTVEELQAEQRSLEIQLHNTRVMNRRAEEALQSKIIEKQLARVAVDPVPSINDDFTAGINWSENFTVEDGVKSLQP